MIAGDSNGRVRAGQNDVFAEPWPRVTGRYPVIYNHSAVQDARECLGSVLPAVKAVTQKIVHTCGLAVVAPTANTSFGAGGLPAGSSAGLATYRGRVEEAVTAHQNTYGSSGQIGLFATSMGTETSFIYALEHPTNVRWMVLFSPVFDLAGYYTANTQSTRAVLEAAWVVTYPAAFPATGDIYARRNESGLDIPILVIDSSDDPYSAAYGDGTKYSGFVSDIGASRQALGAVGHGNGTVAAADLAAVAAFVQAHT